MDTNLLTALFTGCFWFGTAATVLSFVFGVGRHGQLHVSPHGHAGGAHGPAGTANVSPFNVTSLLAFLVVFGAVGLVLQDGGVVGLLALALAALAGLVGGWLAFLFLARFLLRGETYLRDEPMVGIVGTVSAPITGGRVGEIMYTRNGVRRSDGARAIDGGPIGAGEEVVVVDYQRGIATVQRWHEFLNGAPTAPPLREGNDGRGDGVPS
jgi:hypothetical protein